MLMPISGTTHICLVLDRSGSMQALWDDALGSVNSYITTAKWDGAVYHSRFSLITFSSASMDMIRKDLVMKTVKPLSADEYRCGGNTPLFDAVGRGIGVLNEALGGKSGRAILVIMTDGQENDSVEFNHESITSLIKARQEAGWLIMFLGEGLDVAKQGMAMGAPPSTVAAYAGGEGLRAAGRVVAMSTARYAGSAGDVWDALEKAAFTPQERDALVSRISA
jgi:Mg-chelatase subunit ChlD